MGPIRSQQHTIRSPGDQRFGQRQDIRPVRTLRKVVRRRKLHIRIPGFDQFDKGAEASLVDASLRFCIADVVDHNRDFCVSDHRREILSGPPALSDRLITRLTPNFPFCHDARAESNSGVKA
jgi:hypothetical protein